MQADIHGTYGVNGMQDVCNDSYPRLSAAPEVKEFAHRPGDVLIAAATPTKAEDPCFGWRCPGCRSCHAPTLQTCPVCDERKKPLVQSFVIRTLQAELDAAPSTLTSPTATYTTVHVQRLLVAVLNYHQRK